LGIDVYAKDVLEQDAFALGRSEFPFAARPLIDRRVLSGRPFFRFVVTVPVAVPIEEMLICRD
jgi:hypothetical protein